MRLKNEESKTPQNPEPPKRQTPRNPLLEGDKAFRPCVKHLNPTPSEALLRFNEKQKFLPHSTKYHSRPQTSFPQNPDKKTFGSLKKLGARDKENEARLAITYESGPRYQEIPVTGKISREKSPQLRQPERLDVPRRHEFLQSQWWG